MASSRTEDKDKPKPLLIEQLKDQTFEDKKQKYELHITFRAKKKDIREAVTIIEKQDLIITGIVCRGEPVGSIKTWGAFIKK